MDNSYRFWNRMARRYSQQPLADEAAYLDKLRLMRADIDPFKSVFEFGCGTGATALILSPHAGCYRAVDFSQSMIDIASDKAARAGIENLNFECAAFGAIELADESVDVVIAMSVLHLMDDWQQVVREVSRALRPGGTFFSSTACITDIMPAIRYVAPLGRVLGLLPRLSIFGSEELERCMHESGFEIYEHRQASEKKTVFVAARKVNGEHGVDDG